MLHRGQFFTLEHTIHCATIFLYIRSNFISMPRYQKKYSFDMDFQPSITTSFFWGQQDYAVDCLYVVVHCFLFGYANTVQDNSAARKTKKSPRSMSTAVTRFANLFAACKDWLATWFGSLDDFIS
ncbi:MAG: hypothetical protein CM15mV47_860 [uncultured marine virus]|nr:MAG: hypothetical protein CM15mV47_860 [uncultured marine virus]